MGTALVVKGLDHCKYMGFGAVVVLGHPDYYPRFGFVPSTFYGLGCEFNVPEDTFMVMEILSSYLKDKTGTILYNKAFRDL